LTLKENSRKSQEKENEANHFQSKKDMGFFQDSKNDGEE